MTQLQSSRLICLLETHPAQLRGSMARYARLVEQALHGSTESASTLKVVRLSLGFPYAIPAWLPARFHTWVNHCWLLSIGRIKLARQRADLYHLLDGSYAYLLGKSPRGNSIITVHDLIPSLQRENQAEKLQGSVFARSIIRNTHHAIKNCRQLIADSASTQADICRILDLEKNRIRVIYPPLEPAFLAAGTSNSTPIVHREKSKPFMLHLGNNAWYKNRAGVVRIFHKVSQASAVRLVMAGSEPDEQLLGLVRSLSLQERVEFRTQLDDKELITLYQQCALFLFPSLYEGFGWPPLEAMACGAPVVCSLEGSLPEVVGDAALTARAAHEDKLAEHCLAILADSSLAQKMTARGRERAAGFSLELMGKQLRQLYTEVLDNSKFPQAQ